jgi:hypothetical protein
VGHDRRLSVIKFQTYWPFRDEKGQLVTSTEIEPRDYLTSVKRIEITDELFMNMKKRDDIARGGSKLQGKSVKRGAVTQPQSPTTTKKKVSI